MTRLGAIRKLYSAMRYLQAEHFATPMEERLKQGTSYRETKDIFWQAIRLCRTTRRLEEAYRYPKPMFETLKQIHDMRGPEYAHEDNDCVVRGFAICGGMPYSAAHTECKRSGRKDKQGHYVESVLRLLNNRVCNYGVVELTTLIGALTNYGNGSKIVRYPKTIGQFLTHPQTQTGRYLLRVRRHVLAVIDGVPSDATKVSSKLTGIWRFDAR